MSGTCPGDNSAETIAKYAPFWRQIADANGTVNSAYGNRIFGHNPIIPLNQWEYVKNTLTKDKDSRQAIVHINVPNDMVQETKDFPCTLTLQFFVRNNSLHLIVNMRSNDVVLGLTNDLFQFTMLQELMMLQLRSVYPDLELGMYHHNAGSMHVYERHFDMLNGVLESGQSVSKSMIPMTLSDIDIQLLIELEKIWRVNHDCDPAFDFTRLSEFQGMTDYWQKLVLACFGTADLSTLFV